MELFSHRLAENGLNLQAVIALESLPPEVYTALGESFDLSAYSQLLLIGHGGSRMWQQLLRQLNNPLHCKNNCEALLRLNDPIDCFTESLIEEFFRSDAPQTCYSIIYPGDRPVGLQKLGELAGWHYPSPFMVGINSHWGTWYAYRAAVLAQSDFSITPFAELQSPCVECAAKPCYSACPAGAVTAQGFSMSDCIEYRLQKDSRCQNTCLARVACPAGRAHRYSDEQLNYHYLCSFATVQAWKNGADTA
ncbi:MAG: hypothetical protein MI976_20170 [Pseudomonadales bacterium]|nr:hypothetical protein [Pseudomonadales bacterium]